MKYWQYVNPACMTEESDADDGGDTGDKIINHRLVWRSECKSITRYIELFVDSFEHVLSQTGLSLRTCS